MPARLTSVILKQANEIKDKDERVNWLRENATYAVRGLLNFNFHQILSPRLNVFRKSIVCISNH